MEPLTIGQRVELSGGYDGATSRWLGGERAYRGTVVAVANESSVAFVRLDEPYMNETEAFVLVPRYGGGDFAVCNLLYLSDCAHDSYLIARLADAKLLEAAITVTAEGAGP